MEETKEIKLKRLKTTNKILNIIQTLVIFFIIILGLTYYISNNNCNEDEPEVATPETIIKATFNNKFTAYVGENKSLNHIKALVNIIISNNAINQESQVKINNITISKDSSQDIFNQLADLHEYTYSVVIDSTCFNNEGYITNVKIKNSEGKQILVEE